MQILWKFKNLCLKFINDNNMNYDFLAHNIYSAINLVFAITNIFYPKDIIHYDVRTEHYVAMSLENIFFTII